MDMNALYFNHQLALLNAAQQAQGNLRDACIGRARHFARRIDQTRKDAGCLVLNGTLSALLPEPATGAVQS